MFFKAVTFNKVYKPVKVRLGRFWQMNQFPNIGEFGAIVLIMEVTLINDDHYAHNIISLYSKASRPEVKF